VQRPTKTIGVLGGMGSAATVDFYRRLIESTAVTQDQDHLHILIDNNPLVPDRTAFLLGRGEDPTPTLIEMARGLTKAGAELLIMACNTASAFVPQVAASVAVPLLNWVEEASIGVASNQPSLRKIGLLATTGTVMSNMYQRALALQGVSVVVPSQPMQEQVMDAIYGTCGVKAGNTNLQLARHLIDAVGVYLQELGVEGILLACTELSLLYASQIPSWFLPTFDAAQIVAERVVTLAGGSLKPTQLPTLNLEVRLEALAS